MAAVIELRTGRALSDERLVAGSARPVPPRLRVIHGGRSPHARRMRRTYLVRRVAAVSVVVVAVWVVVQLAGAAFSPAGAGSTTVSAPAAVHRVEQGDTLWALAEAVDPDADPRDVVDRILRMNEGGAAVTPDGRLLVGEHLRLPVG